MKTNECSYKYSYDVLNRLNAGVYAERGSVSTGSFNINTAGFNESGITYDDNGNILSLQRNSSSVGAASNIQVDNLTYTYDTDNPNRLKKVVDGVGANYISYGFSNLTGSSSDYGYDSSGNLVTDPYKGLSVSYNELNRADQITITTATNRYIRYTYDSGGQLLRKQAYDNAVLQKTTDYIDGFVYENSTLAYFAIPEGRVVNVSGTLTPEFVIADQQGNARITFRDDGSGRAVVTQENSYYAFGLTFATSPVGTPAKPNKNLYNGGSEWQNDFSNLPDYYQTFFRNYDQALGRFVSLDPMAEAAESLTGYNYSGNNPVMFNDPLGDKLKDYVEPSTLWEGCEGCQARNAASGARSAGRGDAFMAKSWQAFMAQAAANATSIGKAGGTASGYSMSNGVLTLKGTTGGDFLRAYLNGGGSLADAVSKFKVDNGIGGPTPDSDVKGSYTNGPDGYEITLRGKSVKSDGGDEGGGETSGWTTRASGIAITLSALDGPLPFGEALGVATVSVAAVRDLTQKKYITYTLRNPMGKIYVGRTSGYGDPYSIMKRRYNTHHMKSLGYRNPSLDAVAQGWPLGYAAIRGREQDAIDAYGGIGSPLLGNVRNGIWEYNFNKSLYKNFPFNVWTLYYKVKWKIQN